MEKINIVFIDDHRMLTNALSALLKEDHRFGVIGETSDTEYAIKLARSHPRSIFLVEIGMVNASGIDITFALKKFCPGSKVIILSVHALPSYAKKMIRAGAMGYVTKNSSLEELVEAILEVNSGKKYICKEIRDRLAVKHAEGGDDSACIHELTNRELDVIHYIRQGLSSREIAAQLGVSIKTTEAHRYNILKKLKLRNVAELVNYSNKNGLL